MKKTRLTETRIFSKRLDGFLWNLARWKIDILGYNILIDMNKELRTELGEKRDQS